MRKEKVTKGFSASEARAITRATQRQLDYWDEKEIVRPSIRRRQGKGKERRYSYTDLLKLRIVVELRRAGLSLQRIRKALRALKDWDANDDALAGKRIVTDGQNVFVATSDQEVLRNVIAHGQLAFAVVFVGEAIRRTGEKIKLRARRKATG